MEPINAVADWWPWPRLKCNSGLRRLEKTSNFLRCLHVFELVLKYGSNINEGNCLQLLFYLIVLIGIVVSVIGMSFFAAVFQVLEWSFLVLHFDGNVCNWIPKVIWPRVDWFWGFLLGNDFSRRLHICVVWNLREFLNCCSFLTTSIFFDV